jgi:hypothetical protein
MPTGMAIKKKKKKEKKPSTAVHVYNPRIWESKTGGLQF